jgi:hypothetical protein
MEDFMQIKLIENRIAGLFLGFALVFGVIAATSATANAQWSDSNRQGRNWDGYPNWGGSYELRQTALNAGFNEGSKEGAQDRARGRRSNFSNSRIYNNATTDYSSRLGDRSLYQRYFRRAFESGYNTEFGSAANNGGYNNNNGGYNNNNGGWNNNNTGGYNNNTGGWNNNNGTWTNTRGRNRRGRNWDGYPNWGGTYQLRQTALNAGYNEGMEQGRNDRNSNRNPNNWSSDRDYQNATKDYSSRLGNRELYRRYFREAYQTGYQDGYEGGY